MFLKKSITSDQIAFWIKKHLKKILFLLCVLIFMSVAFIIWKKWDKGQEDAVQSALYDLQKSLSALTEKKESKSQEEALEIGKEDPIPPLTGEMRQKAALYEKAIKENQSRKIAVAFAIDLADFYYRYKETDKAIKLLSLFALPSKKLALYHLASFQLATYYMDYDNEEGCPKALEILSALRANKKASSFHLESDLQQAFCLEHLNRQKEALYKYENVLKNDPEGYSGRLAKDYKKLLILNKNLKKLK